MRRHVQWNDYATAATLVAGAAFMLLVAAPYPAHGDWTLGADAGVRYDDNVGNAQLSSDRVADSTIDARLSIFRLFPLDESYSATLGGDLRGEVFDKITGLNNATVDAAIALKKKWGLGAFVPWARAGISVARSSYADSYRNAWDYRATLGAGRRLDERWNLWAEYAYENRVASPQPEEVPGLSGDAYSEVSQELGAHLEYSLNESAHLSLGLLGRHGDVLSTSKPNSTVFYASRALAEDPAFGPNAYAYKLGGTTLGFRLGVDYAPTAHSLLGCGFERLDTRAYGGNNYVKSVAQITWDYLF